MTREEELKQIKKESAEIEKHMNDMFDLAFMLNNRNDIMNPQAHYEKLSRMVTHYMGSIQQSYGYMSIKVIEALEQEPVLEQEPCIESLERLAESSSKIAKQLERLKVSEQEPKWIPVSERLPEDGQSVLFCDIDNDIMVGYHVKGRPDTHFSQDGTYDDMKNVRAWMPLPKPYKKESEAQE